MLFWRSTQNWTCSYFEKHWSPVTKCDGRQQSRQTRTLPRGSRVSKMQLKCEIIFFVCLHLSIFGFFLINQTLFPLVPLFLIQCFGLNRHVLRRESRGMQGICDHIHLSKLALEAPRFL